MGGVHEDQQQHFPARGIDLASNSDSCPYDFYQRLSGFNTSGRNHGSTINAVRWRALFPSIFVKEVKRFGFWLNNYQRINLYVVANLLLLTGDGRCDTGCSAWAVLFS